MKNRRLSSRAAYYWGKLWQY